MSLMKSNSYVLLEVFLFRRVTAKQKYVPKIEMNSCTVVDLEKIKILRRLVTVSMKESVRGEKYYYAIPYIEMNVYHTIRYQLIFLLKRNVNPSLIVISLTSQKSICLSLEHTSLRIP